MSNATTSFTAQHAIFKSQKSFFKNRLSSFLIATIALLFLNIQVGQAQAPAAYNMSLGNKTWDLAGTWVVAGTTYTGTDAGNWGSVGILAPGGTSVTSGVRTTKSSATIVTTTSGGFQKPTNVIQFLSTGSTATPEAVAIDLYLNFTGRIAGTVSFDWATIDNASGTRPTSLRVFWTIDGTTFTEITGAQLLDKESGAAPTTGNISVALPTQFSGSSNARLRFYNHAGTVTGAGNRDKMQIDNIAVTSTPAVVTYTVTYNGNSNTSGTAPVDGSSPYASGSNVTIASQGTLLRTGYTFNGWNTAANGSGTAFAAGATLSNITANTTLFAQWTINTYTVTYDGNGNDGGSAPVDGSSPYNFGSNVTVLGVGSLTKSGYTFNGWNTAANGSGTAFAAGATLSSIAANTTLFAQWLLANTYSVTYSGNGNTNGTAPVDGSSPYISGANVTIASQGSLLRTGYTFNGWNTVAGGTGTAYAAGATLSNISANTSLFAQWTINTYTVTYNGNGNTGGTAPVDGSSPYNFGTNVTVLGAGSLTRTNYNFTGWNTAADGSGTAYAAASTISTIAANTTLFAQWTIITYTLTYNGNTSTSGTAPVDGSSPYASGSNVTVQSQGTLLKTGYTFNGWNTVAGGTGTAYAAGATLLNITANTTLFAQWIINTYTVIYNGNGNTSGTAPVDANSPYNFGVTVTVLANTGSLVKTGATFVGWNTLADGTGTNYAATGAVTFVLGAANVTLFAKWADPLYDGFNYTVASNVGGSTTGSGTTNNNWTTHSNSTAGTITVSSPSLSYTGLQASIGNKISIPGANSTTGRDINRSAGLIAAQNTTYYSFLLNITNATQLGTTFGTAGNGYFMHLSSTSGTAAANFTAKVHVRSSNAAANFRLGISETSNTPVEASGDLAFGTTYLVVVKYVYNNTAGNDLATIWINPTSLGGTEPTGGVNGAGSVNVAAYNSVNTGVCIRNSSATPKADIDEIRVGTTWAQVTPAVTYQLTTTSSTGGSITAPATSPITVNYGAATTITATAASGYIFTNWTVETGTATIANAASISTTATLTSGDATLKANFVLNNFTITASSSANGIISPAGAVVVAGGANQTFTFTPAACYQVGDVVVDGLSQGASADYTFSNVAANHTIAVTYILSTFTQWTGAVSTDWSDAANWSSCVPDATKYVYIPGIGGGVTRQPSLTAAANTGDLEMGADATLTLNGNTLNIFGLYADDGNSSLIGSATSNLVINGTNGSSFLTLNSAGTITLKNLTVNGGTLTLSSPVNITGGSASNTFGTVSVANGAVLESNGFLTLKSNQFGTARVAANASGIDYITGDVTVERYIPANALRAWRLLAIPTKGIQTIKQAWQENQGQLADGNPGFGTIITSNLTGGALLAAGFDATTASPSIQKYNDGAGAWNYVTSTNAAIENAKAYFVYIRGSRAITPSVSTTAVDATTLRTKGTLYQGTITTTTTASFTPMANVYASSIDFASVSRTGSVSNTYYLWDAKKASGNLLGAYQTFSATNGFACVPGGGSFTPGQVNTTIQSGQGFFVSGVGSVVFNENAKVSGSSLAGYRPTTPVQSLVKMDSRLYNGSNQLVDANVVVFNTQYANTVDADDAVKYSNTSENFGIQTNNTTLAVEGRQPITTTDAIQFAVSNLQAQTYTLVFTASNMATVNATALLQDAYLGTATPIDLSGATTVSFTVDANAASKAANRFKIVFAAKPIVPTATKAGIVVAPNPIEGSSMQVQFTNQAAGVYTVQVLNMQGKVITTTTVNHAGGSSNQVVAISSKIATGMYKVAIIATNNNKTIQNVIIK